MNIAISPTIYNNSYNNRPIAQNKISFKGNKIEEERKRANENGYIFISWNDMLKVGAGGIIGILLGCGMTGNTVAQEKIKNEILQMAGDSGYVFDNIECKEGSVVNVSMHSKYSGAKVQYDLVDKKRYKETKPNGQVIMHDFSNNEDHIQYDGKWVPVNGTVDY